MRDYPMRILILSNSGFIVHKFRKELVEDLVSKKYEVIVSYPFKDTINGEDIKEKLKTIGCQQINTSIVRRGKNIFSEIALFFRYIGLIIKTKPDVVLTYTIKPNIYGGLACKLLKTPYLTNVTGLGSAFQKESFLKKLIFRLYSYVLESSNCVFFQNQENMNSFIGRKRSLFNYRLISGSGVNLEYFKVLEYPKDDIIKFVTITRVLKEKGIDEYLEAAKSITEKYGNVEFHICGFLGKDYVDIFEEYEEAGIIKYHGVEEDVREILNDTHCIIHVSYHEGMSNVLLENAACARPAITTNISGCKEIVQDGTNGFLVNIADSQDLIKKIEMFIALPYKEKMAMGLKGRERVENGFDRKQIIRNYYEEMNKII